MCKNGTVFCVHSTGPSHFLPRLCVLYKCMHTLFACVWGCASYTSVTHMWRPAINARDHSQSLFHLFHWGRVLQSDPELKVLSSPASPLALGIFCPGLPRLQLQQAKCPPSMGMSSRDRGGGGGLSEDLQSSSLRTKHFNGRAVSLQPLPPSFTKFQQFSVVFLMLSTVLWRTRKSALVAQTCNHGLLGDWLAYLHSCEKGFFFF